MKHLRDTNLTDEQILLYRQRLVADPEAEVSATEVRAILGVAWNLVRNWLDADRIATSPLRWRPDPFDGRFKRVKLQDVLTLKDQADSRTPPVTFFTEDRS